MTTESISTTKQPLLLVEKKEKNEWKLRMHVDIIWVQIHPNFLPFIFTIPTFLLLYSYHAHHHSLKETVISISIEETTEMFKTKQKETKKCIKRWKYYITVAEPIGCGEGSFNGDFEGLGRGNGRHWHHPQRLPPEMVGEGNNGVWAETEVVDGSGKRARRNLNSRSGHCQRLLRTSEWWCWRWCCVVVLVPVMFTWHYPTFTATWF